MERTISPCNISHLPLTPVPRYVGKIKRLIYHKQAHVRCTELARIVTAMGILLCIVQSASYGSQCDITCHNI